MQIKSKRNFFLLTFLVVIKFSYIYLNVLMLPDLWQTFDFDRKIDLTNILFEMVFYLICLGVYSKFYRRGNAICFLMTVLFCIYFIPINSTMSLSSYSIEYFVSVNIYCILLFYLLGKLAQKSEKEERILGGFFDNSKGLLTAFRVVTIVTCFLTFGYVYIISGEINFTKVFQEETYDVRAQLADFYMDNTDGMLAYMMLIWSAFYSMVLIIGLYLAIVYKHYLDSLLILITYFALYTLSMEKSLLMKPIIAIFISFMVRKKKLNQVSELFIGGFVLLMIISIIEYIVAKESVIYTLIIRRIAYMPSYLTHVYYDFFNAHDKVWFTRDVFQLDKIVNLIYSGRYSTGIVQTIAEEVYGGGIPSPNTGLFAEAFAQAGYLGVLIFPPIVVLAFKYLYKCSRNFGIGASMVILAQFALSMISIQLLWSRAVVQILIFVLFTLVMMKMAPNKKYIFRSKKTI